MFGIRSKRNERYRVYFTIMPESNPGATVEIDVTVAEWIMLTRIADGLNASLVALEASVTDDVTARYEADNIIEVNRG